MTRFEWKPEEFVFFGRKGIRALQLLGQVGFRLLDSSFQKMLHILESQPHMYYV